jgi:hypothetical protein
MRARGTTAAMILLAGTISAMAAAIVLSPDEIKATFGTGKPFTAMSSTGGKAFWFTFKADGNAIETPKGKKKTSTTGTWRISDKGYCTKWDSGSEHCYTVEKSGARYDVRDSRGSLISSWSP